jgi:tyrosyl-tRNA synthetase
MEISTDEQQIEAFLTRGVEKIFPAEDFLRARLKEGERLTIYLGIDPTADTLHLGHASILLKLRDFQDMGHKVVLLIGDFTGRIGDPTDKSAARTRLSKDEVLENAKQYKQQAGKILRFEGDNSAELQYNSEWLGEMSFEDVIELSAHFTVQQMLQRDMFKRRMDEEKPIYIHEFMYPLMQAYDCVEMGVDGEIGGNDQTFNMLAGRELMKEMKGKEKFVIAMKLLTAAGGEKMGKTTGNMIRLDDDANDMFGKVMSWPDSMILPGFEILTRVGNDEVEAIAGGLEAGENPKDAKVRLAKEVVELFYDQVAADKAAKQFEKVFANDENPDDMDEYVIDEETGILNILNDSDLTSSKSQARRMIDQGAVRIDDEKVDSYDVTVEPTEDGVVVQKGKRHFVRVVKK